MLAKHKLDWILEPFTCTKAQKTSNAHIVLGTGLKYGHEISSVGRRQARLPRVPLVPLHPTAAPQSKPHDLTAFRGGASYFDTPWPTFPAPVLVSEGEDRPHLCGNQPVSRVHRLFFTKSFSAMTRSCWLRRW